MFDTLKATARSVVGTQLLTKAKLSMLGVDTLTIFSLHGVEHDSRRFGNAIPATVFKHFVEWANQQFTLTTFQRASSLSDSPKPLAIMSFDDGYRSYKENVIPVLEEIGVEANLNIIPRSVETGLPPINVFMQEVVAQGTTSHVEAVNQAVCRGDLDTTPRHRFAVQASRSLKNRPIADQEKYWVPLMDIASDISDFAPLEMLTLEDIKTLPNTELGVHSYEHASMEVEKVDYFHGDLARCKMWFQTHLNRDADLYAFPNGSASPEAAQKALDAGYRYALLVGDRYSRRPNNVHHRINVHGRSLAQLRSSLFMAKPAESPR